MNIGVVYVDSGWILQTIATKMCEADERFVPIPISGASGDLFKGLDALYFVDVQGCWNPSIQGIFPHLKHVGAFTHLDKDSPGSFREGWDKLDGVVHMCQRYDEAFYAHGWYKPSQMRVIVPGEVRHMHFPKTRFVVVQRGEHAGKGAEFLPGVISALPQDVKDGMELAFYGRGWMKSGGEYGPYKYFGVQASQHPENNWCEAYRHADYLLIPSLWEGGPMSLLEALATGTGIIAADVGFVPEFFFKCPSRVFHMYDAGDVASCADIIRDIVRDRLKLRSAVDGLSYANYAAQVHDFIEGLSHDS